jgi:hypothetical protein
VDTASEFGLRSSAFCLDSVPAYDEAVIPWQTSRAVIIDHFKKFGEVTKV